MTGFTYQHDAMRTNDGRCGERLEAWTDLFKGTFDTAGIINACLGLSGEVGELNDLIKKWIYHGKAIDIEHVEKEIGDICWYIAMMATSFEFDLDRILEINIEKIKARYPEGFSVERSNHRKEGDI